MVFILHTLIVDYYFSLSLKHHNTWVIFWTFYKENIQ